MTDIHQHTTTSDTHTDVYDLMRELMRENPDLNERKLIRKWRNIVRDDPDMTDGALALAGLYIYNAVLPGKKRRRRNKETKLERSRKQMERNRKQMERSMFSFVMPNAKPLGDCTFGEVGRFGEGFARLAKMGQPNEVIRDKLTQAQARKAVLG